MINRDFVQGFKKFYDTILLWVKPILTFRICILMMTFSNLPTGSGICSINSSFVTK